MGSAAPSNSRPKHAAKTDVFGVAYQRWLALFDYEPTREPGETLEQFEARSDRIGEEFRTAESSVLLTQPANHIEMIAMLDVVSRGEEIGPEQRAALCSIQSTLAPQALRETGSGLHAD